MSRIGQQLLRASGLRIIVDLTYVAVGLFLIPIIVGKLGDRYYGIWVLAATFLGFYGLFDLGISSAVLRFTSRALGTRDDKEFRCFFATSFYLIVGLSVLLMIITTILAWVLNNLLTAIPDGQLISWLIIVVGFTLSIQLPAQAFIAVLASHLRYDLISAVQIVEALLRLPLVILVFRLDYGLLGLALIIAVLQILRAVIHIILAFRVHLSLTISPQYVDNDHAKTLMKYGLNTLMAEIADLLRFRISPFIITVFRSVSMVTPYAIADRLSMIVIKFMRSLMGVLSPVFSRQEGRGDKEGLRASYLFSCRVSTYSAVLLGGLMLLLGAAFIERWLGPDYTYINPIMQVLVVGNIFSGAQMPTIAFLYGTSRNRFYAITNSFHGLLCLGLVSALILPFGLMGVAIGITLPTIIFKFFVQPIYACRALQIRLIDFYIRNALKNFIVAVAFITGIGLAVSPFLKPMFTSIFLIAGICCALYIPYIYFFGFGQQERRIILDSLLGNILTTR